jgi:hypothetical protein
MADAAVEQAIAECLGSRGSAASVRKLRDLIELQTIERLTIVTTDWNVLRPALDETFDAFAEAVGVRTVRDWLSWIVATALTITAERTAQVDWVDRMATLTGTADARDGRILVFLVLLGMDGRCQWYLLQEVRAPDGPSKSPDCESALARRLRALA